MKFGIFLIAVTAVGTVIGECDDGWIPFFESCYGFGTQGMVYHEAVAYCVQYGGYLVQVDTNIENAFIRDWLRKLKAADWWMGLNDRQVEGEWVWLNNTKPGFTDWVPGQPNDYGHQEDCAHFAKGSDFQWKDYQCSGHYVPICEKKRINEGIEIIG